VDDGTHGFVVSTGDLEGLSLRLAALVDDPALRDRMGSAARRRMEQEFSHETWTMRMRDYLAEQVLRAAS
jgi:glycosyltransferase involved in cell wall biosynthesis